jgi:ketosteroid isomerase-like protein
MATEQALYDTAIAFTNAFANLDANTHTALRAATCTHIFAPSSVNPPPPMTNEDFATHLTKLHTIATGFPVTTKEIHVNFPKRQVIIWASAVLNFREEVKGLKEGDDGKEWNYVGEYMFLLDLDKSGKITRIVEFLDSLGTERARVLIAKAWKNAGESEKLF